MAFEHNIEREYASKLIEIYKLTFPEHIPLVESWPWKLKVRVFNELDIDLRNESFNVKNKSQSKALELLQVLAAMGGKNVDSWRIAGVLWPEAEGDAAHHSLETNIHRLRKLIGKELIEVHNSKLSLSVKHCWTDVWQFEAIVAQLDKLLEEKLVENEVYNQVKLLLNIYPGVLLRDVDAPWLKFYREKYIAEFLRSIDRAIDYLQAHSKFEQVIELTHQAILRTPDRENFYLQAMLSYRAMGQNSKALDVFRRCEEVFRHTQGSSLSSQILELTDSLR